MLNMSQLLATLIFKSATHEKVHDTLLTIMIILMCAAAVTAIILVLLQPANSSGIDALGGSSETFFGKNKGKSFEVKMKKWTWICLAVLVVFSVAFYIIDVLPVFYS